jgi:hypothetical protein
MGVLSKVSAQLQKKHKIDKKPYLKKVTITDLKNLSRALVEADATPGSPACETCCCCCAAAVEPVQL